MRIGVADHLGWAVVVAADDAHRVVDRRRIALIGPDCSEAPVHYDRGASTDDEVARRIAEARASIREVAGSELDDLADALPGPVRSLHLRSWPTDFPTAIEVVRRSPWEARADAVMYRQVLADLAADRGWDVVTYEAKHIEADATALLGDRAAAVLHGPRDALGAPWAKDHRTALAATIVGS